MSSVDDLLFWDRNFYRNKLGKGTLIKELQTRGVLDDGKQTDYALGLFNDRGTRWRELWIPCRNSAFPRKAIHGPVPLQCVHLRRQVADIYLHGSFKPEQGAATPSNSASLPDPAKFARKYLDPRKHEAYTFTASAATCRRGAQGSGVSGRTNSTISKRVSSHLTTPLAA